MATTDVTSLREAQSLAAKKVKDGSYNLVVERRSSLHHNPKDVQRILSLIPPKAWRKIQLIFVKSSTSPQELSDVLESLQSYPSLAAIRVQLLKGLKSRETQTLSKWLMRTGTFEMLQTFVIIGFEWSMRSLQCFCKGIETIRSLKKVDLGEAHVPKYGVFYVKEAMVKREVPLIEFVCRLSTRELHVTNKSFFMFAEMIQCRKIVRHVRLLDLDEVGTLKFLQTATARSPEILDSTGVRTKLTVKLVSSYKLGFRGDHRKSHVEDPSAQALVACELDIRVKW